MRSAAVVCTWRAILLGMVNEQDSIDALLANTAPLLSLAETAELLRVSRSQVSRWIKRGELRSLKLTKTKQGSIRVSRDDIASFLRASR